MPTDTDPQSITFNQYGVLYREIAGLREDLRQSQEQLHRMLADHETRLRRQETLVAIGVTTIVITVIVVGIVLALLLRGTS
jgi:hypothetical protein